MPSGGRGRKFESSHPDQIFFIELASCCLFGRYHELTISPLPEFCRTPLTGKLPASRNPNRYFACLPKCSAREHCLGSAGPANLLQSANKPLKELRRALSEYGRGREFKSSQHDQRFQIKINSLKLVDRDARSIPGLTAKLSQLR